MKNPIQVTVLGLVLAIAFHGAAAEEVKIRHGGLTLNANLEKVDESWPAGPVVLMTHGTLGHRGLEIIEGLQGLLAERGISSLGINLSLDLNDRPAAMYDCPTPHTHKHTDAVDEIGAWLDWLKGQGAEKVALFGHSRGANQTSRFAAENSDPVVVAVILVGPQTWSADYAAQAYEKRYGKPSAPMLEKAKALVAEGKGTTLLQHVDFVYLDFVYCEDTQVSAEALVSYSAPDKAMDTPYLIPRIQAPVLIIVGSEDTIYPDLIEKHEPLADGEHVRFLLMDGAGHFFRDLYAEDMADAIAEQLGVD